MIRSRRRMTMIAAAVGLATVGMVGPAQAAPVASSSTWVNTGNPKTRATEALFYRAVSGTHANKAWFRVNDTKCDGNDVYVEYIIDNGDSTLKYASGGCGTGKEYNVQSGRFGILFRSCVDDAGNNTCSEWRGDNNY